MSHIVVSDIHGSPKAIWILLSLLSERGWEIREYDSEGVRHPVLHHPEETLIVAGDSNDRGSWSVPFSYLIASSWVHAEALDLAPSVIPLMGNHDLKISRWADTGYGENSSPNGFGVTYEQLMNPQYAEQAKVLKNAVPLYPYWYVGKSFIAVHAYWESPAPNFKEAIYGINDGSRDENGFINRYPWWEEVGVQDKAIIFGHYHAKNDMLFPEKNIYCIDNHDAGVFTYALIEDGKVEIREHSRQDINPLLRSFMLWREGNHYPKDEPLAGFRLYPPQIIY